MPRLVRGNCCPVKSQTTPIGYHLVQYRICRLIGKMPSGSGFFKHRNYLQQCVARRLQLEPFAHDCHQHIDRDGNPYLRLHGVLRGTKELVDPKVLFYPFEKSSTCQRLLYRSQMVKACYAVWLVRKISVLSFSVSRKQMRRVVLAGAGAVQCDGLIRDHAAAPVGGRGINPMGIQIGLGTRDEEGTALVQRMQAGEVDIPAIHDVNGTGFGDQHIKSMNIVQLAVRDMDEARDVAAPIEQRVHPHGGFGGPKMGPREHRHAQIDGRGVQRIDGVGQVQAKVFCGVETSGLGDQPLSELSIDAPVARLVGIGERGTVDRIARAHMVKLRRLGREARLNVPQTLAIGQLCERHDLILRSTGQLSHRAVAVVARDNPVKRARRQKIHELCEQRLAGVHGQVLPRISSGKAAGNSNPPQQRTVEKPYVSKTSSERRFSEPDTSGPG